MKRIKRQFKRWKQNRQDRKLKELGYRYSVEELKWIEP